MDHLSWQWRAHIAGCKLFLTLLRAELAVLINFFAKCINSIREEAKNPKISFFSLLPPPKWPKKLTYGCLPKIWIDPYIWQAPSNVLITGWEDLALNAGALPIKMIDPYFWQTPSNVLVTGLEEEEALHISGKRSIFLAKLRGSQKMASLGPKNDFIFTQIYFFLGFIP